ncbi:MAG: ubiquinol-cytochrome C reductase, partial [Leptotrichia sp.]
SGKTFNFTGLVDQTYYKFSKGTIFKVYFYGKGNRNLTLETFDYIR